ncbi:MAG: glutathione peroxidase [Novibacillus thermophilus]|uniref:Glutathione peroxidase n=1 Tax=Novibacillus thermophilus TaxID=1471761 RepID=A0A1U9K6I4_9BACL|nr:glutathione peroxidase [Novibacillus thermophilus]AQS55623.1 glutathione peroxidase [Novibacillus thermophilus]
MSVYQFSAKTIDGQEMSLAEFKGRVLLIVNTASKCGFTPQYKELQELYEKYRDEGFTVLGFPCNQFMNQEPGSHDEIRSFCQSQYGVSFPMFQKVEVNGKQRHPLFRYLTKQSKGLWGGAIKWNFTKFLVDATGHVYKRYAPIVKPLDIEKDIRALLAKT